MAPCRGLSYELLVLPLDSTTHTLASPDPGQHETQQERIIPYHASSELTFTLAASPTPAESRNH